MNTQDFEDNPYVEVAKYAFAAGGGLAVAWVLVRHGTSLVKKVMSALTSKRSTISVEHVDVEVITPESADQSDYEQI